MKMPDEVLAKEREMLVALWEHRKKFWEPEDDERYWEGVVREAEELAAKFKSRYFDSMIRASVDDLERRSGKRKCEPGVITVYMEGGADVPARATEGSAGYDLKSMDNVIIMPGETEEIHTGFHATPPRGIVGLLFIRSGLSKKGLRLSTGVSVIDQDYTGEVVAYVRNDSCEVADIRKGDRVCQIVYMPFISPSLSVSPMPLPETGRGGGGFGSTGK